AAMLAGACLALRKNRARVRYWLWLAASAKFLVPFSLLVSLGARLEVTPSAPVLPAMPAMRVERISSSFAPVPPAIRMPAAGKRKLSDVLGVVWLGGILLVSATWIRRWNQLRKLRRQATPAPLDFAIPVAVSPAAIE